MKENQNTLLDTTEAEVSLSKGIEGVEESNEVHQVKPFKGELTLNEPLKETIMRDLRLIYAKLRYILDFKGNSNDNAELRNWDLWGPFVFCLLLAILLSIGHKTQVDVVFSLIFLLISLGSAILTINARLLGSKVSLLQNASVIGYCLAPLIVSSAIFYLTFLPKILRSATNIACVFWAIKCAMKPIASVISPEKKWLVSVPLIIFFLYLDWFILMLDSS